MTPPTLDFVLSAFGASAKQKLSNAAATGAPEDQLRAPFEQLLADLAGLCNFAPGKVGAVGETSLADLRIRPDYSVTVHGAQFTRHMRADIFKIKKR